MERVRETLEAQQVYIYFAAMGGGAVLGVLIPSLDGLEAAISPALAMMLFATFMQVPLSETSAALRNKKFIGALVVRKSLLLIKMSHFLIENGSHLCYDHGLISCLTGLGFKGTAKLHSWGRLAP